MDAVARAVLVVVFKRLVGWVVFTEGEVLPAVPPIYVIGSMSEGTGCVVVVVVVGHVLVC